MDEEDFKEMLGYIESGEVKSVNIAKGLTEDQVLRLVEGLKKSDSQVTCTN